MARLIVLHLRRPYANAEEYLAREAWTLDTRAMLLVDQPELPAETDIVFDVTLGDGTKPIRAEARVIGPVAATANRPGGLQVRFRRYGAATRAFVERAVEVRSSTGEPPRPTTPPPPSVTPPPGVAVPISAPPAPSVTPASSVPPAPRPQPVNTLPGPPTLSEAPPPMRSEHPSSVPGWDEDKTVRFRRDATGAVVPHAESVAPRSSLSPPPDRDDLLERLRRRVRETEV